MRPVRRMRRVRSAPFHDRRFHDFFAPSSQVAPESDHGNGDLGKWGVAGRARLGRPATRPRHARGPDMRRPGPDVRRAWTCVGPGRMAGPNCVR